MFGLVASAHFPSPHSPWDSVCTLGPHPQLLSHAHRASADAATSEVTANSVSSITVFGFMQSHCSDYSGPNRTGALSVLTKGSGNLSLPGLAVRTLLHDRQILMVQLMSSGHTIYLQKTLYTFWEYHLLNSLFLLGFAWF